MSPLVEAGGGILFCLFVEKPPCLAYVKRGTVGSRHSALDVDPLGESV